jgi:nitroreductase
LTSEYDTLLPLLRGRRSIRRFRPDPVPEETIEKILEAARWAPSAGNRQAFRLLVVRSRERLEAMAAAVEEAIHSVWKRLRSDAKSTAGAYLENFTHFGSAPLVVVPIHRGGIDLLRSSMDSEQARPAAPSRAEADALCSVSAAVMNLLLAAHTLGLGACWMTGPLLAASELARLLEVPTGWTISALIPVGTPAEAPEAPPRRELDRLVVRID